MKMIVDLYDKIVAQKNSSGGQKYETGSRVKQVVGEIMRYGRAKGETKNDPTAEWILENQGVKSHYAAALTEPDLKKLINLIYYYDFPIVRNLLLLNAVTFTRPGEARNTLWKEIDLENKVWRIPGIKMKNKLDFLVLLSEQTLSILNEMKYLGGGSEWVFPSPRSAHRPLSDGAGRNAFRVMGYGRGSITIHGFRKTASTFLNEEGLNIMKISAPTR